MRRIAVKIVSAAAFMALAPAVILSRIGFIPVYSRYLATSKILAMIPGLVGILLRRVWYRATLAKCGRHLTVDWMGVVRDPRTEIGDRVTIGAFCWISWASIGDDVMFGNMVSVLSGGHQHQFARIDIPMRQQGGEKVCIRIGSDVWLGAHSVIIADVAGGSIVGAGAVVTKRFDEYGILLGIPARLVKKRNSPS
jgi:acetyltransferase-like isoleucine patch superfamily enzyme